MKFRVSGCYWSKDQFRNRGIHARLLSPEPMVVMQAKFYGRGSRDCYAVIWQLVDCNNHL
jgi:hypothetical protein